MCRLRLIPICCCLLIAGAKAQLATQVATLIQQRHFTFKPAYIEPAIGHTLLANSSYTISIGQDSIISLLPYIGEVYLSDVTVPQHYVAEKSTHFNYQVYHGKKNRLKISIKPIDIKDIREWLFTVNPNGTATLWVNYRNKDAMFYEGEITGALAFTTTH